VPDRLSYSEMYEDVFKYASHWTESFESYLEHKSELMLAIHTAIDMQESLHESGGLRKAKEHMEMDFFSGTTIYDTIANVIY